MTQFKKGLRISAELPLLLVFFDVMRVGEIQVDGGDCGHCEPPQFLH